jgi:hypothetical protein
MNRSSLALLILESNFEIWDVVPGFLVIHKKTKDIIGKDKSLAKAIIKAHNESMKNPRYLL